MSRNKRKALEGGLLPCERRARPLDPIGWFYVGRDEWSFHVGGKEARISTARLWKLLRTLYKQQVDAGWEPKP